MSDIIIQESLVADFNWNCHPQSLWLAIEKLQECALLLENVRQIKHIIQWNMTNCTEKMCHWHRCKVQYCMVHGWQQWLHVFVYINIESKQILYYTRYIDDIIIYDTDNTNQDKLAQYTNSMHNNLQTYLFFVYVHFTRLLWGKKGLYSQNNWAYLSHKWRASLGETYAYDTAVFKNFFHTKMAWKISFVKD